MVSEGANRIVAERYRHFEKEGWTIESDVRHYQHGELVLAAISYAGKATYRLGFQIFMKGPGGPDEMDTWPKSWLKKWDKRGKHSTLRCLEIAGSLIAAEIDRRLARGEED